MEITLRATDETPDHLRRFDGQKYPLGDDPRQLIPAPGNRGTLMGVPGVMRAGLVWEITAPLPTPTDPGPPWAQALASELADIKRILGERDESAG